MNKVPFALQKETNKYVGVHEVERGLKCECICPSCKTPLSARKGNVNTWHFSHATRGTSDQTDKDCEFSFFVSVTQMAKQIFAESKTEKLHVPSYLYDVEDRHPIHQCRISREILITPASDIEIGECVIEGRVGRHQADVVIHVGTYQLVVGLSHKHKAFLIDPELLDGIETGVINIDLTGTLKIFSEMNGQTEKSFKSLLREYLLIELDSKEWLYHSRQDAMITRARELLLKEPIYISAAAALKSKSAEKRGDFIDRALDGFELNRKF
ncbi:competence protein CoiA family protein [Aliamphritea hakodatensis]|uniref:competence protein CoiA family protein n=1 Tax=Aliamphritea hakodatensis TaxID=2895352 RepID=UPI0022FDA1DD|nr:hypothetical protein [Aliamphritea hakodatensis]